MLTIQDNACCIPIAPDNRARELMLHLEGRRRWLRDGQFQFENTPHNLEHFKKVYPEIKIHEKGTIENLFEFQETERPKFEMATKPFPHQERALAAAATKQHFALFMEQGTGKSKVAIDRAAQLWCEGYIDNVIVISKKGVHAQWAEEQLPLHISSIIPKNVNLWPLKSEPVLSEGVMNWLFINVDALIQPKGRICIEKFLPRSLMIIDESQTIKNSAAQRTKYAIELGRRAKYRMILTGTPIAKDLTDEWSQFKFLDENVLGHRYLTSFRAHYCVMGGFENRQVIGHKNIEEFKERTGKSSFRVLKEDELNLPPKMYANVFFEMEEEQARIYDEMKKSFIVRFEDGEITAATAAAAITKLQQIACGFLYSEEKKETKLFGNPRLQALLDLLAQREGQGVIWARFNKDIEITAEALGLDCATYYGPMTAKQREEALELYQTKAIKWLVANPAAGGTGLNLQGDDVRTVVYYSNSFNALDRWQSEDRTHRIGTKNTVTYFDLIARKTVDARILANLRNKKSLSDLALGDVLRMIKNED